MEKYKKLLGANYLFTTEYGEIPKKLKNQIQKTLQIDFEQEELKAICWIDTPTNFISQYQFVIITSKRVITQNATLQQNLLSDITGIEQNLLKNIVIRSAGNRTPLFFASNTPNKKLINRLFGILNTLWLSSKEQSKTTVYKDKNTVKLVETISKNMFPTSTKKEESISPTKDAYKEFKQEYDSQQAEKTKSTLKLISKWVIGIFLSFLGIGFVFGGSFFGGLLVALGGLSIIPPISEKNKAKYPFWRNKHLRRGVTIFFLIIGFAIIGNQSENKDQISKEDIVIKYVKKDTLDKSIRNIRELGKIGEMFDNGNYSTVYPHQGHITEKYDSIMNLSILTFNPKLFRWKEANELDYLANDKKKGRLNEYIIKFEVDSNDSILSKKTIISYSRAGTKEYENSKVPDLSTFINKKVVENQKLNIEAEKLIAQQKAEYEKRAKAFEENCFSAWDGSHSKLKRLVEENLNDPDSFEHLETRYKMFKGYAIVVMEYRASNRFGAKIKTSITAKVDLENCEVLEVVE